MRIYQLFVLILIAIQSQVYAGDCALGETTGQTRAYRYLSCKREIYRLEAEDGDNSTAIQALQTELGADHGVVEPKALLKSYVTTRNAIGDFTKQKYDEFKGQIQAKSVENKGLITRNNGLITSNRELSAENHRLFTDYKEADEEAKIALGEKITENKGKIAENLTAVSGNTEAIIVNVTEIQKLQSDLFLEQEERKKEAELLESVLLTAIYDESATITSEISQLRTEIKALRNRPFNCGEILRCAQRAISEVFKLNLNQSIGVIQQSLSLEVADSSIVDGTLTASGSSASTSVGSGEAAVQ
ncbi:MAG: hypothetical protein HOJ35_07400 [Bdellovibrionales bacterium]|jgi:hypothetical protein|nr:hypothetical protein [Bdellovibrionales bacterium]